MTTKTRAFLLALLGTTALGACGGGGEPAARAEPTRQDEASRIQDETGRLDETERLKETERLNAWFDATYEEGLQRSPMRMTMLGRKDAYDRIDDMSEAAEDERMAWMREKAEELRGFDRDALTEEAATSYDLWLYQLEDAEAGLPFRRRAYVFNQMQGSHAFLPQFLINFHKVETEEDMTAYVARLGGISRALEQLIERAELGADEGVRPPRFAYEGVRKQALALLDGAPFTEGAEDSPLYADAKAKLGALAEAGGIDESRASDLEAEARRALIGSFEPAYRRLVAFIDADMPNVSAAPQGASALPDGEAYYAYRLRNQTTTGLTADEVHRIGLDEVARIRAQMEGVMETVGFEGTLPEFFAFVRTDPRFYYPDTDEGREAYLEAARAYLDEIDEKLPEYFGLLPKADLIVKRVEAFREEDGGAQHYFGGTPDGSRPGIFYAHLSDMAAMPILQLEVIAYHEGNPGHHMQISIAQELEGVPEFRTQAGFGAYQEGWALYSEQLAEEMGQYEDPYSYFGRLTTEIWRAIRLVVDTGMHAKGWSEEEAVAYFTANSPAAEGQIRSEIRRYLVWPGQATSYKIGMLKILELRERSREALGDDFRLAEFHDVILGGGALPLDLLEARVDRWLADERAS